MNVSQLASILDADGIDPLAYCLTGGLPNEAYTIEHIDGGWRTYYSERGQRTGMKLFDDEAAACNQFRERLLADQNTRKRVGKNKEDILLSNG